MTEPAYPVYSGFTCYQTRDWREDYCTDCHFFFEDNDMGAAIPWCCKKKVILNDGDCTKDCLYYIKNSKVTELVNQFLATKLESEEAND